MVELVRGEEDLSPYWEAAKGKDMAACSCFEVFEQVIKKCFCLDPAVLHVGLEADCIAAVGLSTRRLQRSDALGAKRLG